MSESTNQIWEEFSNKLRVFILKRVKNKRDAEDILQDVFLKIHKKIESLESENKLRAWIYQITRNAIIDFYRKRGKRQLVESDISDNIESFKDRSDVVETETEITSCLKSMIEDLPEKYKEAILMIEYEALSQKELAKRLGLTISSAKSRIQRARKKLKNMFLECCHFEFDRLGKIIEFQPKEDLCKYCIKNSSER